MTTYPDRLMPESLEEEFSSTGTCFRRGVVRGADTVPLESRIAAQLQSKGVETFLPLLTESHRWSDRQKTISLPLFSGYVFVRLSPSTPSRSRVLCTEGVMSFVNVHGDASPIPSRQIEDLRRLLAAETSMCLACLSEGGAKSANSRRLPRRSARHSGGKQPEDAGHFDRVHSAICGRLYRRLRTGAGLSVLFPAAFNPGSSQDLRLASSGSGKEVTEPHFKWRRPRDLLRWSEWQQRTAARQYRSGSRAAMF